MAINNNMVTTVLEIPGYSVVQLLGIVRGISIYSWSRSGAMSVSFQLAFRGDIMEHIKKSVFDMADSIGALIQFEIIYGI